MINIEKLPEYLRHDIEMVEKYDFKSSTVYDCYLDELWGSINMCWTEGIINWNEAEELRKKYYWNNLSKGEEENA